ncbi:hypothetical protein KI387_034973, partial [Taxus chinensis]
RKWTWRIDVRALATEGFLFFFQNELEMQKVLLRSPWFYGKQALSLHRWEPGMPHDFTFHDLVVWISLPALPLEFWEPEVLLGIARSLGKLIAVDSATKSRDKLVATQMCVNVPVGFKTAKRNFLNSPEGCWDQQIDVESSGIFCSKCRRVRYERKTCFSDLEPFQDIMVNQMDDFSSAEESVLEEVVSPEAALDAGVEEMKVENGGGECLL